MADARREYVREALREARGNRSAAAQLASMNRQYFQKLLKHHGLTENYTNRGNSAWTSLER
jgi:DNA-binding NtrC family response regulator